MKLKNFSEDLKYEPGDHLGVFACNRDSLVDGILKQVSSPFNADVPIELQIQKQVHTPNGKTKISEIK